MNRILFLLLAAVLLGGQAKSPEAKFDYYAMALSWSPTYCAAHQNDKQQCGIGRSFAFVVHGLWPQFEKGWPSDCSTTESWVEQSQIDAVLDIMPSKKLIIHEWKKHGTCSGLSQKDFFGLTRTLFEKVRIPARYLSPTADVETTPDQLVTDFVKTNKNLNADMISVQCGRSKGNKARLSELRICFDRDGVFRKCGENEQKSCRAETLVMPRVRGGN
jgi:ribonuclease T2